MHCICYMQHLREHVTVVVTMVPAEWNVHQSKSPSMTVMASALKW